MNTNRTLSGFVGCLLGLATVLGSVAPASAADESLELVAYASSHIGEWKFLQGAPIDIMVHLVNGDVRRAREQQKEDWLAQVESAERDDLLPPQAPEFEMADEMNISLGDSNVKWFEDVALVIEREGAVPTAVLSNVTWDDLRTFPLEVASGEFLLGEYPVWVTLRIPPSVSATLEAGSYRISVSGPNMVASEQRIEIVSAANTHEQAILDLEIAKDAVVAGRYEEAIEHAKQAIGKLEIDHDAIYLTLGRAYAESGELELAVESFEKFLDTFGSNERWEDLPQTIGFLIDDLNAAIAEEN